MILILGGTAAYHLDLHAELGNLERVELDTPYGAAFPIFCAAAHGQAAPRLAFASRHGVERLAVTPPFVNARANLWAAHALGVRTILSWNGVGAINPLLTVDDLLVLDGVLDYTKSRQRSFSEHTAPPTPPTTRIPLPTLQVPFAPTPAAALYQAARTTTERAFPCGVYACSEGPRLESAAEIAAFGRMGADVVGMTLVPEVLLARELGIAFAALASVTNYATGITPPDPGTAPRHFGAEVAQRCLALCLQAAHTLATHAPPA